MRKIVSQGSALLNKIRYNYIPVSTYKIQNKPNPIVAVTLGSDNQTLFDLHFRLFENAVPRTAQNFKRLLLGTASYQGRSLSLLNNYFHHYIQRSYVQLGHLQGGNSSIFGPKFRDQSFQLPHDRPGLLSCVSEENTCNSRFLITFAPCPFLDLKNVVFGEITSETFHNLKALEKLGHSIQNYKILQTKLLDLPKEDSHGHHH